MNEEKTMVFTLSQLRNLRDFIEINLIATIRDDEEVDNIEWICEMCDIYKKLIGAIESNNE